ncbi:transcription factor BIM1 isoform X3 [Rhododendron vialii]|uniref:transcription factor BIM1 isoform X3 n=1 Tax=Rhododendron vialii TaxID=182163 RepID=UPI00265DCED9|nr:transcription factor BIM1 isoform X3 [Rhododendron vialii]
MELRQPRPFGAEGRKSTHDFLSLYSPVQQDPRPTSQGAYLKTHDFLQPLEGLGKNITKEENSTVEIITTLDKPPPLAPPPTSTSGEHLLPGGIGTYSISHISNYFNQTVLKPEGAAAVFTVAQSSSTDRNEENSNSSSFNTGSGFTLWEESAVKKGKTGKENVASGDSKQVSKEARVNIRRGALGGGGGGGGQWATSGQRPSQSSSNHIATNHRNATTTFSSLSSSQPPSSQKNQTFMDILKSAKVSQDDDDDDEEEFVLKKEPSLYPKNDLSVKLAGEGGKSNNQKPNTPRSKHSATEQRRRSKINDRFQMLRDLIPHSDQKRDKASFLLEVIEYIQFLQEKVDKYEGSYQGWNQEPPKLMPWQKNNQSSVDGFVDQSQATNSGSGPKLMFAAKFDEDNIVVSPTNPQNGHNGIESDLSTVTTLKEIDLRTVLTNKAVPLSLPLQPNMLTPTGSSSLMVPIPAGVTSGMDNVMSQPQSPFLQSRSHATDNTVASNKLKEQELTIESGKICISSVYSQGLLNTLTQALQSSGIDLSRASISVQIDLGKRANGRLPASTSTAKDVVARSRAASSEEESDQALKRLKKS